MIRLLASFEVATIDEMKTLLEEMKDLTHAPKQVVSEHPNA